MIIKKKLKAPTKAEIIELSNKKTANKNEKVIAKQNDIKQIISKQTLQKSPNKRIIKRILVSQPKPEGAKSPYFDLAKKYALQIDFESFIRVQGISAVEFKTQKINISNYTAVIFTSKNAIEHYFRLLNELKYKINPDVKYFCVSEPVALYLHKFIIYRRRKVFYGEDNLLQLSNIMGQTKHFNEKYLLPYSNVDYNDFITSLENKKLHFTIVNMYKVLSNNIKEMIEKNDYDMVCLFTQGGIKSLFENFPNYKQGKCLIAVYGHNTLNIANEFGLQVNIAAPTAQCQSMCDAIAIYLNSIKGK